MKKFLIMLCFLVLIFSLSSYAGWTNAEDYQAYKVAKKAAQDAEAAGDTFNAISNYKKAAELAAKSGTPEIQMWQINNAAYFLIKQFKLLVGYDEKLQKLSEMKPGKEKINYQSEIANLFNLQMPLLEEAKDLLKQAQGLIKTEETETEEAGNTLQVKTSEAGNTLQVKTSEAGNTLQVKTSTGPEEKIKSNLQFISWVEKFLADNLKQEPAQADTKQTEKK